MKLRLIVIIFCINSFFAIDLFSISKIHNDSINLLNFNFSPLIETVKHIKKEYKKDYSDENFNNKICVIYIYIMHSKYTFRITILNKSDIPKLTFINQQLYGIAYINNFPLIICGKKSKRFFIKENIKINIHGLIRKTSIKPIKSKNKIPYPPIHFEPPTWIYVLHNNNLVLTGKQ